MDSYGPLCILMIMDPYGSLWVHVNPYGPLWVLMDPYGSVWEHMDLFQTLKSWETRVHMSLYDFGAHVIVLTTCGSPPRGAQKGSALAYPSSR